jgi:hypothetical protein
MLIEVDNVTNDNGEKRLDMLTTYIELEKVRCGVEETSFVLQHLLTFAMAKHLIINDSLRLHCEISSPRTHYALPNSLTRRKGCK